MAFSFSQHLPKRTGFTLIELLVVVTIIGILAMLGGAAYDSIMTQARNAKAKGDINRLAKAARQLELDTGFLPNKESSSTCNKSGAIVTGGGNQIAFTPGNTSINRSGLWANFATNAGNTSPAVSNWKGPYMDGDVNQVSLDPWGNPYWYDGDYICTEGVVGCERYVGTADNDRALVSWGKDKTEYTKDDIVYVFCGAP